MKKYDTYKDSGNQWIGQVPEHWILSKIKYNFGIISGCGFKEKYQGEIEGDYPFCKASDINGMGKTISTARNYVTTKIVLKERYNIIPANSILFAKIGEALKKNHRKINTIECIVDNNCQALVPAKNQNTTYMYYLLTQIDMAWFDNAGTIPCVNNQKLKDFRIALPPLSEQQAIVEFLDKKTGQIDQSIALLETQKKDLQAYRKAIISETVTKGLNPSAKLKDSGIQWIGQIPEEWSVRRMKDKYILQTGTTPKGYDSQDEGDELINWFTPADITEHGNILNDSQRKISRQVVDDNTILLYPKGSLIFVGIGATAGKLGYSEVEGYSNQQITALIPKDNVQSKYHFYYLMSIKNVLRDTASYTTMPIINNAFLSKESIPLPPLSEQEAIIAYLDKKTSDIDTAIERINAQIAELQAYRTALISEAVTGKIDVR